MRIGICSPVTIQEFHRYLFHGEIHKIDGVSGLLAPAVDAVIHELIRCGHHVLVFTLAREVHNPVVVHGEKITIYIGRYRSSARIRGLTFFWREISDLKKAINKEKLDVIHAHWTYEFAIAALSATCPKICTIRDIADKIWTMNPTTYRAIRWGMNYYVFVHRKKIKFIANSSYTKEEITKRYDDLKISIIPNPVKFVDRSQACAKTSSPSIVSISNGWSNHKNIFTLISAFKLIRRSIPDAELHLIGGAFTPEAPEIIDLLRQDGTVLEGVFLDGYIPHARLPEVISKAWIMVHPSLEESFGNTLIESMSVGVPVIGGENSGAVPWVLDGGRAGVLCDVKSARAIACVAIDLLSDPLLRDKYIAAGRSSVRNRFSIEVVTRKTLDIYEAAVSK